MATFLERLQEDLRRQQPAFRPTALGLLERPVQAEMKTPDGKVQVWKFPIPKKMRETVKEQGQPLFQIGAGAAGLGTAGLLATEEDQY